jgi:hypothetical protein
MSWMMRFVVILVFAAMDFFVLWLSWRLLPSSAGLRLFTCLIITHFIAHSVCVLLGIRSPSLRRISRRS